MRQHGECSIFRQELRNSLKQVLGQEVLGRFPGRFRFRASCTHRGLHTLRCVRCPELQGIWSSPLRLGVDWRNLPHLLISLS